MHGKTLLRGISASLGMLILILDGQTALEGSRQGLALCLKTVIPSLFPFFLLSILLTGTFTGRKNSILAPIGRIFRIPNGMESILIAGFLGGYPVGAQCAATAWHAGQISRNDAERMLSFCSNAGPAFLFGMVSSLFSSPLIALVLWIIQILSALLVSMIFPVSTSGEIRISAAGQITFSDALQRSIRTMASVCAWVVLFRILITFLDRWILWILPTELRVAIAGALELSNGCYELFRVPDPSVRFVLCSGMLAFGGICVMMQTQSVIGPLSIRYYVVGKLLQTLFGLILSTSLVLGLGIPAIVSTVFFLSVIRKKQKRCSFPKAVGV